MALLAIDSPHFRNTMMDALPDDPEHQADDDALELPEEQLVAAAYTLLGNPRSRTVLMGALQADPERHAMMQAIAARHGPAMLPGPNPDAANPQTLGAQVSGAAGATDAGAPARRLSQGQVTVLWALVVVALEFGKKKLAGF
ncbi:hypothetical protein ABPG75_002738 [Micractinium tetrahymenae]